MAGPSASRREMGEICAALKPAARPRSRRSPQRTGTMPCESGSGLPLRPRTARSFWEAAGRIQQFEILPDKPRLRFKRPTRSFQSCSTASSQMRSPSLPEKTGVHVVHGRVRRAARSPAPFFRPDRYHVGTQLAGRDEVAFERLVGTFVNTVALRTDVGGDPSFGELLDARAIRSPMRRSCAPFRSKT